MVVVWEVVLDVEEVLLEGDGVCFGFRKFWGELCYVLFWDLRINFF